MPSAEKVVVHPLVLLSVVDHYNRVAKDTRKRVVGVLLGDASKGVVDVTNCFAVPFEEDDKDPTIWFLDHSYLENMFRMFKKVNAKERVVGWYSSGPKLREADLDIDDLMRKFCEDPVLVICEIQSNEIGLPIHAYCAVDELKEDGTQKAKRVFEHLVTEVGASEAEEIGVEHLLRDVKDATISTLSTEVSSKLQALKGLHMRLKEVQRYIECVVEGRLPVNHGIIAQLQNLFNLLPNLNVETLSRALTVESNDMMMTIYLASMIRSVIALHNLIDNKERRLWQQRGQQQQEKAEGEADGKEDAKGADAPAKKAGAEANGL